MTPGTKSDAVEPTGEQMVANVVGPGLRDRRHLRHRPREWTRSTDGDLLAFMTAGAYAATMASTYNSRPLSAEVMVAGNRFAVVRDRQSIEALINADLMPSWLQDQQTENE